MRWISLAILGAMLTGCSQQKPTASKEWDTFVNDYLEAYFAANPSAAAYVGRHDFDGKLPDWSKAGIQKEIDRLKAARAKAQAFDPKTLDEHQQFDRDYVVSVINGQLFWLDTAKWPFKNPTFYGLDPNTYVAREYAPIETRIKAYTAYAKAVPLAMQQIRENLQTPMPREYADIGKLQFGGLASYYEKDVPTVFGVVKDAQLQADFKEANALAIKAAKEMDTWFADQQKKAQGTYAMGPELFREMIRATENVDLPLDKVEQAGRQDMDRNLAALKQACQEIAPDKPIADCLAKVNAHKPQPDAVAAARQQIVGLKAFVQEKGIVSIPGTEEAKVDQSPPYQRYNFAYMDPAGPYEKGVPSIYYVAPPDPNWTAAERDAYIRGESVLLFTTVHEVMPGHFLQFLHSNRVASPFGRVFVGYAFAEGWGHYAEELMWEAGYKKDPETHVGQLLNALLRNGRYLSAIGLHTKGMTVEQSEKLFLNEAYQDPGGAKQQARRGTFDPPYLNYLLGKLMIRKLRADWTASRGGEKAWREFHDTFLSFGGPPIPLIRQKMLGAAGGPPL